MPHREAPFTRGEFYHLYNRGNDRQSIFFERENYLFFLRRLREYLCPTVDIVAYCLMPNHYHLLVRVKIPEVSRAMMRFSVSYVKAINERYDRVGSLFQGRFKAVHVDREEYLVHLSRYIHLNPVFARLVRRPEGWEFSSYREYIGLRNGTLPKPAVVLSLFPSREAYQQFVESYTERDSKRIEHLTLE